MNQLHKGESLYQTAEKEIINCISCGYAHVIPLPSMASTLPIYLEQYWSDEKITHKRSDRESRWQKNHAKLKLNILHKTLNRKDPRLLEVGCGVGIFLETANELGWQTTGIELSPHARKQCVDLGLNVPYCSIFDPLLTAENKFDVIHFGLILEHLINPVEHLLRAKDLLTANGLISIVVPNDFNPLQKLHCEIADSPPWWVSPDHHINYFNQSSINHLLSSHGITPTHISSSFPMEFFLLSGDNYTQNGALGRACHEKRVQFENSFFDHGKERLLEEIYTKLGSINLGREIFIIGTKNHTQTTWKCR
ncbi:MAG: class I SAM-dependent methyltransferase [Gammaproteobacteria bacterium]|nr:class I SAM-dependent methyltransferase [Gammaproteobacteria bacterium]